jgi:pimeloyl-ACP methyl ester carboxylesterase
MAPSLKAVLWGALLIVTAPILGSVLAARKATSATYVRRYDLSPSSISEGEIELPATEQTLTPGEFGLQLETGGPPVVIGQILSTHHDKVTRRLVWSPESLSLDSRGRWSGIVATHPTADSAVDAVVETPIGEAPAWVVNGGAPRWAIHVHGHGSDRTQTLRGVETATRLGLSSLVISYRNDGEGPRSGDARSHLGEAEWLDLEAALRLVADYGGTECVIFGWSMGATMALDTLRRSPWAGMIKGLVLVSPVLSWEDVLRANARRQRYPQFLGSLVTLLLASKGFSHLVGLDAPLHVRNSDRARIENALNTPTLILHNRNDWSVPFETSSRFATTHKSMVKLMGFDCAGHTQEWNSDPVGWDLAVRRWYEDLFPTGRERATAESQ